MPTETEIALEKELAAAERTVAKLRKLLALYRDDDEQPDWIEHTVKRTVVAERRDPPGRARSPERQAVLQSSEQVLEERRGMSVTGSVLPMRTGDIYRELLAKGVKVPGTNPANNLSAMLSASPVFLSHGRRGWTLTAYENPSDAEPEEEASEGAEPNGTKGREVVPGGGT